MQSFRTELENPIIEKDIIDLEKKIYAFQQGNIGEEKFRSLRLARGVYGQRQPGVQMIRIKIPMGRFTARQLNRIADVSDEFSTGNLHITTRQDIQLHYVQLNRTPELWTELEKDEITLREACGNTVRNVTASIFAGIDPLEPFDVTPFAEAFFTHFLRNPVCQELGRKIKVAFSSSNADTAYTFFHDLGFIPVIERGNWGFKMLLGGGIGAQPRSADILYDFIGIDELLPISEAIIRVFDRYGERNRRNKARLKFLIKEVGITQFMEWVSIERKAIKGIPAILKGKETIFSPSKFFASDPPIDLHYEKWLITNVFKQKQEGYFAVGIPIKNGNFSSEVARKLADIILIYTGDDSRFSPSQSILLRHIPEENLVAIYNELKVLGLASIGFNRINDIVACPGTDTCNLGIGSSMGLAEVLKNMIEEEYVDVITDHDISIKISGCMNACGQHTIANIGFQGMTIQQGDYVAPATQVLLGGGLLGNGLGRFADKVLKVPSRRVPLDLRWILDDFMANHIENEDFNTYYDRKSTDYFFQNLKLFSDITQLQAIDFIDWGNEAQYEKAIGVGECAGVMIDLIQTLLLEADELLECAMLALEDQQWSDSIYHAFSAQIRAAKAILTAKNAVTNSHESIIQNFDFYFPNYSNEKGITFLHNINKINKEEPSENFASAYLAIARKSILWIKNQRNEQVN
jgi:sulfite reductase (ferredoxin)